MDYGDSGKRKSKNDKKAKSRYNRYKKGGRLRATGVKLVNKDKEEKGEK